MTESTQGASPSCKPVLAWVVSDTEGGVLIFHRHGIGARREAANELGIDFEDVESCRRAPEFDQYAAAGRVPVRVLLDHGWWFECHGCGQRVALDLDEDEDGNPLTPVINDSKDAVYCDQRCRDAELARIAKVNADFEAFKVKVQKRFPGVEFTFQGGWPWLSRHARFQPEGFKYPAEFRDGEDDDHLTGSATRHDQEAFLAWLEAHPKPAGQAV